MNIYFINLPERMDKYWAQKVNLHLMQPGEGDHIIRFPGVDSKQYPDYRATCEGMQKEGFNNYGFTRGLHEEIKIGSLYATWSHMKVLQKIVDDKVERSIVLEDDTFLTIPIPDLKQIIYKIGYENIDLLFLDWFIHTVRRLANIGDVCSWVEKTQLPNIFKNVCFGGARARFWTLHGAERFLETWKNMNYVTAEAVPSRIGATLNGKTMMMDGSPNKIVDAVQENYGDNPPQFYALDPKGAKMVDYLFEPRSDIQEEGKRFY